MLSQHRRFGEVRYRHRKSSSSPEKVSRVSPERTVAPEFTRARRIIESADGTYPQDLTLAMPIRAGMGESRRSGHRTTRRRNDDNTHTHRYKVV